MVLTSSDLSAKTAAIAKGRLAIMAIINTLFQRRVRLQGADLLGPGRENHAARRGDHERPPGHSSHHQH
eukprot:7173014-Heterocapsa_arctica.AAC.1